MKLTIYCFAIFFLQPSLSDHSEVVPGSYTFPTGETVSDNGSSATGHCSNVTVNGTESVCSTPTTSVLFDKNIPTLTGLDGNMWATQLLTLQTASPSTEITFDFTDTPDYSGVETVEVVMLNCLENGFSVSTINLLEVDSGGRLNVGSLNITTQSCDALLKVCLDSTLTLPMLGIEFELSTGADRVYLAEVTFNSIETCPTDPITILDGTSTMEPSVATAHAPVTSDGTTAQTAPTAPPTALPTLPNACPPCPTLCRSCPSCSSSTVQASAISIVVTAVLATIIFVLVQIVLCMYLPRYRQTKVSYEGKAKPTHLEEEEGGATIMHNPVADTFIQGEGEGGREEEGAESPTFELQGSDAYIISNSRTD